MGPLHAQGSTRPRRGGLLPCGALVVALFGCAGEAPPAPDRPPEDTVAEPTDSVRTVAAFVVDTVPFAEGAFPHRAHASVTCTRCHADLRGHATHATTACAECHTPPGTAAVAGPAECNACHHAPERNLACTRCHAVTPAPVRPVSTPLVIANRSPVTRSLPFDHARHDAVACRTCHTGDAALAVETTCASCHTDHHRPAADCSTCHAPFPLTTHEASAHRGCAGAGCHEASPAWALPQSRNACLSCHRAESNHEPEGECRSCHPVSGGGP